MNSHYAQYYLRQVGAGLGDIGTLYHAPLIPQRGRGIGSFFSGAFNYLRPLFSSGLDALKNQAIKSGASILDNVGTKPLKEVLKEQGKIALQDLAMRGANKLKRKMQGGEGKRKMQRGKGKRKSKKQKYIKSQQTKKKSHSTFKRKGVGKGKKKRKSRIIDIFNN